MASIYTRPRSPWFWICLKGESGKWVNQKTSYRTDNPGDRRQAQLLARKIGHEESIASFNRDSRGGKECQGWEWVDSWMEDRYHAQADTKTIYKRYWRHLRRCLPKCTSPETVRYQTALEYRQARAEEGIAINTILHELKLLGVVMGEAVRRGLVVANPICKLGIRKQPAEEKKEWTDAEISKLMSALLIA